MSTIFLPVPSPAGLSANIKDHPTPALPLLAVSPTTLVVGAAHFLESYALTKRLSRPLPLARRHAPLPLGRFAAIALAEAANVLVVLLVACPPCVDSSVPHASNASHGFQSVAKSASSSGDAPSAAAGLPGECAAPPCILLLAAETMALLVRVEVCSVPPTASQGVEMTCCSLDDNKFAVLVPPLVLVFGDLSSKPHVVSRIFLDTAVRDLKLPTHMPPADSAFSGATQTSPSDPVVSRVSLVRGAANEMHPFVCLYHEDGGISVYDVAALATRSREDNVVKIAPMFTCPGTSYEIVALSKIVFGPGGIPHGMGLAYSKESARGHGPHTSGDLLADDASRGTQCRTPAMSWVLCSSSQLGNRGAVSFLKPMTGCEGRLCPEDFPIRSVAVSRDARLVFSTNRANVIAVDPEINPSTAFLYTPLGLADRGDASTISFAATCTTSSNGDLAAAHHFRHSSLAFAPNTPYIRVEIFRPESSKGSTN